MTGGFTRRTCIAAITAAMAPRHLNAQQTPIIGVLDSSAATAFKLSAFYEGLKVEGFVRNQNLTVEYRSADADYARLPELAADLVNRRVASITALGSPAALAAKAATTKTPVVFAVSGNPIEIGLVDSPLLFPAHGHAGHAGDIRPGMVDGWSCCRRQSQPHPCLDFFSILQIRTRMHKSKTRWPSLRRRACR